MFGKHTFVWKALVWVIMPFTLVTGLPRMHCRCAEARGLLFCECCFRTSSVRSNDSASLDRDCCHQMRGKPDQITVHAPMATQSNSDSKTCAGVANRPTGNCCSWVPAVLTAPTESVTSSFPGDLLYWEMILCDDSPSILASFAQHDSARTFLPQLDRITVYQHLVI